MKMVISCAEFSFNNTMSRQTDGIAIGSWLGPVLANIFLAIMKIKLNHNFKNDMWMRTLPFLKMKPSVINFLTF